MNRNIKCLIQACNQKKIKYIQHHKSNNLLEIIINKKVFLFANLSTPINMHSIVHLQQDKDYFFSFFKDIVNMPKTKSYLNPHCNERYS
jgi:hypothetical protein